MKKIKLVSLVLAMMFLFCTLEPALASYNDERFEVYVNMNNKVTTTYVVPNLYRQDSAYPYFKNFPLVVSGGVEYVPISMFTLFSYITVTYSKINDNFYITNSDNSTYLSFDVSQNKATTNDGVVIDIETKIFYRTRYLPARKVAEILGVTCETYDEPERGYYCFRIRDDAAKLSLEALLDRYLPKKKEETPPENTDDSQQNPEVTPPQTGEDKPKPPVEEKPPQIITPPEDPYEKTAKRQMYFVYTDFDAEYFDNILSYYNGFAQTAAFCMTAQDISDNVNAVRNIIVYSHTLVVGIEPPEDPLVSPQKIAELFDKANEALYDAAFVKTRLCIVPENVLSAYVEHNEGKTAEDYYKELEGLGYVAVRFNCSVGEDYSRAYGVYNSVVRIVTSQYPKNQPQKCIMQLKMTNNSGYYTSLILDFLNKYQQFSTEKIGVTMFSEKET